MAIANVITRGGTIFIYDEKGHQTGMISNAGNMVGYTGQTVNIRRGAVIFFYDEKGRQTGMTHT